MRQASELLAKVLQSVEGGNGAGLEAPEVGRSGSNEPDRKRKLSVDSQTPVRAGEKKKRGLVDRIFNRVQPTTDAAAPSTTIQG